MLRVEDSVSQEWKSRKLVDRYILEEDMKRG